MSWPTAAFDDVLMDVTGGNEKTKQSDYAELGAYPIVDQGQSLVGGYTDDAGRLCKSDGPVIVFGDHTKALKFIDFPFGLGADGTKVLKAKEGTDAKYLFYALHNVHIPDAGYSRHFKYLKAGKIPLPPLNEQKRIAGILDQADALRRLRTRALEKLNTLGQAIFHEMFISGGQPTGPLSDILTETQIGPFGSLLHKSDYVTGGTSLINPMHINGGQIQPDPDFSVSDEKLRELKRYILRPGDIIMGRRGEMGRCAVISATHPQLICGTGSMVLRVDQTKTTPEFLAFFLSTDATRRQLENVASGVTMLNLNTKSLDAVSVPFPSFVKQEEFSKLVEGLEQQVERATYLQQTHQSLYTSLQHRAFRSEL